MNNQWSKLIANDLNPTGKKQYDTNTWYSKYWKKNSRWYPSNKANNWLYKNFQKQIPSYNKTPSSYRHNPATFTVWHLSLKWYPNVAKTYFKIFWQLKSAQTDHLVKWYVRKYPNDFVSHLKFRDQERVKIRRVKKKKDFYL